MKYTKQELMAMPLQRLRLIDVQNKEEEGMIQEVVTHKMSQLPSETPVQRIDVPDIKTKEEEEYWQKIIDERTAKLKPKTSSATDANVQTPDDQPITVDIDKTIESKAAELKSVKEEIDNIPVKCEICGKVLKPRGLNLHKGKFHKT